MNNSTLDELQELDEAFDYAERLVSNSTLEEINVELGVLVECDLEHQDQVCECGVRIDVKPNNVLIKFN